MPLAPPGTKVVIHEKPQQRKTWDPHGAEGWYLGPAMEHYRCHRVFTNKTRAERITDTVEFFPQHTTVPSMTTAEIAYRGNQSTNRQHDHGSNWRQANGGDQTNLRFVSATHSQTE
jgi:hypothetical protein